MNEKCNIKAFRVRKGFTLIELLVVVLIIGILAAVALPQYQKARDRAKYKTVIAVMRTIIKAENLYKLEYGEYTYNWEELARTGIDIPYTSISKDKNYIYLSGGESYSLGGSGDNSYVFFHRTVSIYGALSRELWICYPKGTVRGKQICKYLGCAEDKLNDQYCFFNPNK